jgi:1,4-alpha-glucan branching enzyme
MKRLLLLTLTVLSVTFTHAQLLTWTPPFPKEADASQSLVITVDATKGNAGLLNFSGDVFVHIGAVTSTSNGGWSHVPFTWATSPDAAKATFIGNNKWTFTIAGSLRSYFSLAAGENLLKIGILFRNADGTKVQRNTDASDMYVPIYTSSLAVRIDQPARQPMFVPIAEPQSWTVGTNFNVVANASNLSTIKIYFNGALISTGANTLSLTAPATVTASGNQQIIATANDGMTTSDTMNIFVAPATSPVAALPAGVKDGINYEPGDTSVTLVLRAPGKGFATVIGEFNNWTQSTSSLMNKTPDGNYFWLRIHPLAPGVEYAYQYMVDGSIRIPDPYTEKILDPGNDGSISAATYPNLKPYPAGQTGIVSIVQTQQPTYTWAVNNFARPDKRGLVIYELLARDFIAAHDWKTLKDTLGYLKRLGVNAVEVMPFNEFNGNLSWGYNPFMFFAPDKYYGPKNTLKQFIDSCHKNGIAVIMDIVLNHTYGPSPLATLYWDAANNRPAADNPWYNVVKPHAYGFGEDFNHASTATKDFFNRVLQHWITEYKIDGYRFDFSKGLTQKASTDEGGFAAYDATRIAIINQYYNTIKAVDPTAYLILEHFTANSEEKELGDNGMMVWSNQNNQYMQASMGHPTDWNFEYGIYSSPGRGWTKPGLVTYAESHDEERVTYKNIKYGNGTGGYNIKDTATALKRMELDAAFLLTIPGPKMIWQFGELGYDYSRCYLSTNNDESGNCDRKTEAKPIRWDYLTDPRRQSVFNTYSKLNALRFNTYFREAFQSGAVNQSLGGAFKWIKVMADTTNVMVIGNFDVTATSGTVTFQSPGTWYDYLNNNAPFYPTGGAQTILLQPGEFHVYVNRNVNTGVITALPNVAVNGSVLQASLYPNPATGDFTVSLTVPQAASTSFDLFSAGGQFLGTLKQSFLVKGAHRLALPRNGLPAGTYFLRITNKANQTVLPLILQ